MASITLEDPKITLGDFNGKPRDEVIAFLLECCDCPLWAERVADGRSYQTLDELRQRAREVWEGIDDAVKIALFNSETKIGDRAKILAAHTGGPLPVQANEQAGVAGADAETLEKLRVGNEAYKARHGFTFIVFATGKTAEQMLSLLESRMNNATAVELRTADEQKHLITDKRLRDRITE